MDILMLYWTPNWRWIELTKTIAILGAMGVDVRRVDELLQLFQRVSKAV